MTELEQLLHVVQELLDEQRAIRHSLDSIASALAPGRLKESDVALLHAIWNGVGNVRFTAADLVQNAELVLDRREDPALYAAIVDALGTLSARKLGARLAQIEGRTLDGLRIQRLKNGRDGIIWKIVSLKNSTTH